jgi:DNA-directed RNA polymerase subunit RPC12/RpoP
MTNTATMHGREVLQSEVPEEIIKSPGIFCHDCGSRAKILVTELSGLVQQWNPRKTPTPLNSWFWCGICDIGV